MAEKKTWYFVIWEERHPRRPFAQVYNDVTEEHPVDFLIDARKASSHRVSLLFWVVLDEPGGRVAAWKKKLEAA